MLRYRQQGEFLRTLEARLGRDLRVKLVPAKPEWMWRLLVGKDAGEVESAEIYSRSEGAPARGLLPGEMEMVSRWTSAKHLTLAGPGVDDESIRLLHNLPALYDVMFIDTPVTSRGLAKLRHHPRLADVAVIARKSFAAGRNDLVISADAIEALATIPGFGRLSTDRYVLDDSAVAALPKLKDMGQLWLCHADLSDADLERIAELPRIGNLGLNGNPQITDGGVPFITCHKNLSMLALLKTGITVKGLGEIVRTFPGFDPPSNPPQGTLLAEVQVIADFEQSRAGAPVP
jgi:hypothetical protein